MLIPLNTCKYPQISVYPFHSAFSIFPTSQDWLGPNMRLPQHIKPWKAHGLSHLFFSRHTLEKFKVSLPASRRPVKSIPTGVQSCFSSWMCIPLRSFVPNGNSNLLIQLASFIWQWPTISGSPGWAKFSHWHLRLGRVPASQAMLHQSLGARGCFPATVPAMLDIGREKCPKFRRLCEKQSLRLKYAQTSRFKTYGRPDGHRANWSYFAEARQHPARFQGARCWGSGRRAKHWGGNPSLQHGSVLEGGKPCWVHDETISSSCSRQNVSVMLIWKEVNTT